MLGAEGTEQVDLDDTNLLALLVQVVHGLLDGLSTGTHGYNDLIGVLGTDVVVEMVLTTTDRGNGVHGVLDVLRNGIIEGLGSLNGLEEHVSSHGETGVRGVSGVQGVVLEGQSLLEGVDGLHLVLGDLLHGSDFVRGSEAIVEVEEGDGGVDASDREGEERHTQRGGPPERDREPPGRCERTGRRNQSRGRGRVEPHTKRVEKTSP